MSTQIKKNKWILFFLLAIAFVIFVAMPVPTKKVIPQSISKEVNEALSYYPELDSVPIEFKFKKNIKKSTMQAQPNFRSLFRSKKNRAYVVLISKNIKITGKQFKTEEIPYDVMVGWIGHELGHIKDYQNRSSFNLVAFGFKYLFSPSFIREAERTADTFAVSRGMGEYIIATKNFILDHAEISEAYKERLNKFYLSPEEIMVMLEEIESTK